MREILFRGKGNPKYNTGEWYEGYLKKDNEGDFQICGSCWSRTVIPETVGQYTGVTDINGTKIFEGDIVKAYGATGKVEFEKAVVCWDVLFSGWRVDAGNLYGSKNVETYEIIGNIHDNPEMLNGSEAVK